MLSTARDNSKLLSLVLELQEYLVFLIKIMVNIFPDGARFPSRCCSFKDMLGADLTSLYLPPLITSGTTVPGRLWVWLSLLLEPTAD